MSSLLSKHKELVATVFNEIRKENKNKVLTWVSNDIVMQTLRDAARMDIIPWWFRELARAFVFSEVELM